MDRVMVRGRLDVMLPLSDGLLVADYKTDRVTAETVDARVEFYREQIVRAMPMRSARSQNSR